MFLFKRNILTHSINLKKYPTSNKILFGKMLSKDEQFVTLIQFLLSSVKY